MEEYRHDRVKLNSPYGLLKAHDGDVPNGAVGTILYHEGWRATVKFDDPKITASVPPHWLNPNG